MKMNLSVVMETVDKMTAPLKNINANQDHFTKKIEAAKQSLKDNTGTLTQIQSMQKMTQQLDASEAAMRTQEERIAKLNEAKKKNGTLTAAQEQQLLSARQKLGQLTDQQKKQTQETWELSDALKASGVDTKNLAKESDRLGREYTQKEKHLTQLTNRFERLRKASAWSAKAHGMIRLPTMSQLKGAAMGVAGLGATVAGYFSIVSNQAGTMDALQKSADSLNMPISELQALQSQAKHAGMDADKTTESMNELAKQLGELQTMDSGKMAGFLKGTRNPLYKELKDAKSTDEAYQKILAAFGELKSGQEEMAFADAVFGGNGKEMLLMLRQGTEGLTEARKEFNELGGGVSEKDARSAEAFNDSWQKIQEIFTSVKSAAMAPVMEELTKIFTKFTEEFKSLEGREETIKQAKAAFMGLFNGLKTGLKILRALINYFPEIVAGLLLLKIGFFALNAVMMANPVGWVVAGIAALVVALTWAYTRSETFREILGTVWKYMTMLGKGMLAVGAQIGSAFTNIGRGIISGLLTPVRAIFALLGKIPKNFLPEGIANGIEAVNAKMRELEGDTKTNNQTNQSNNNQQTQAQTEGDYSAIKNPQTQTRTETLLRIKSDQPVEIERVKTDGNADLNIETGDMMLPGF